MQKVGFTQMKDGTQAEYLLIKELEKPFLDELPKRIIHELAKAGEVSEAGYRNGYRITRLEHALQSATRAHADGADVDWIVTALLHDIGDGLSPKNHGRMAAEILRPYVREECTWVVENHGSFTVYYYGHHYGWDRMEREKYRNERYYQTCVDFCERWDQNSFDDTYVSQPLKFFEPMVTEVFTRAPHRAEVLLAGEVRGLPKAQIAAEPLPR